MDKHRKLRRYQQKDYSMLVEFPVEIVGRNGVVRTYSFVDSVRLYQRRIASAASRYDDDEVIRAEVGHCRRRIKQLRRSWFERYAWAAVRSLSRRELAGGEMAAEVAAFLTRYTGSIERAERFEIEAIESSGGARIWYLAQPEGPAMLLYLYRFGAGEDDPARRAAEVFLASLEDVQGEGDLEHLHASHFTADCGLLLTGSSPPEPQEDESDEASSERAAFDLGDPVSQAVSMLRAGEASDALQLLDSLLLIQPDHRSASLTAALAAGHLGSPQQAELYVRLAAAYHPDDGILAHQLGIALLQQGRLDEATASFERALELQSWLFPSRLLLILLELHARRLDRAQRLLPGLDDESARGQHDAFEAVRGLVRRARWQRVGLVGGVTSVALSFVWFLLDQPLALACLLFTTAGAVALQWLTRLPKPLAVAYDIARRMQVPREMLPPSSEDWETETDR
jgi:tetratricopeptide (TPR) repeat protein